MNTQARQTIALYLDIALNVIVVAAAFVTPLFFLPITSDVFFMNKHLFLFSMSGIALLLWTANFVIRKKVIVTISPIILPLAIIALVSIASLFRSFSSIPEALIGRTGLTLSALVLFFIGSSRPATLVRTVLKGIIIPSVLLSFLIVLSFSGVLKSLGLPQWIDNRAFTPAGNMPTLFIVLAATLPLLLGRLRGESAKQEQPRGTTVQALSKLVLIVAMIVTLSGAVVAAILAFPAQGALVAQMPISTGWQIAVETLKERPILGVGAGAYLSAYTKYRPLSTNSSSIWNQRFQQGPNEIFHTFTETGLLGLMALLFFLWKLYDMMKRGQTAAEKQTHGISLALFVVMASLLAQPLNVVTYTLFVVLLIALALEEKSRKGSAWDATIGLVALQEGVVRVDKGQFADMAAYLSERPNAKLPEDQGSNILAWIFFIPAMLISVAIVYFVTRVWVGEVRYRQALAAVAANDGLGAYNNMIKALNNNPWFSIYHRQYANVNLLLANALASQKDLTDQDRSNVNQLVQQSIREGKVATQLNPADVQNWEVLASIYRALINVADGAQDWTVVAYTEAVRLDPINPLLRINLGGIFFNAKDWDSAIQSFQTATNLKPDFANAYYNLALAYEQAGKSQEALRAMQATIQSLDANSPDYAEAQKKFEELQKKAQAEKPSEASVPATTEDQQNRLTKPEPIPTALPGANRVQLGKEEEPPVTVTPSAAPTTNP